MHNGARCEASFASEPMRGQDHLFLETDCHSMAIQVQAEKVPAMTLRHRPRKGLVP